MTPSFLCSSGVFRLLPVDWVVMDNVATPLWMLTNKAHSSVWKEFE